MRIIIGLIGNKGAGKDTVADFLVGLATRKAQADLLKDTCSSVFFIPRKFFDDPTYKEELLPTPIVLSEADVRTIYKQYGVRPSQASSVDKHVGYQLQSPRHVAQYVGTEMLRAVDPDIHVRALVQNLPTDGVFVVTDVRFPNEFAFLERESLFVPVYVANQRAERRAEKDTHASESYIQELSKACIRLDNNGTLAGLEDRTLRLFADQVGKYLTKTEVA